MARKMTEWPSKRGPITKIMPSDGCIGDTVPLAVGKWYDFHEFGWYMGNVGYIRTARAKGLLEKIVINRHALKNSLLPVVTVIGIEFAFLMGGLVVTEQVFNLNGLGKLFVESVLNHDYALTQALVMLVALIFVLTNFVVDILYAWLDPRIRYS